MRFKNLVSNMANENNYYEILGVTQENTEKEITKAYRKKALKCHPDKNPDNPAAAELFHELSKALEVLLDPKARAAYDAVLKSKERIRLRNKALDAKRKKFKQDLEQQENDAKEEKENDEVAAKRLQAEIERLREEGSRLLQEQQKVLREELKGEMAKQTCNSKEEFTARLRVKWKSSKSDESNGGYSEEVLKCLLSKFGEVNHVILSIKKKGSAIVEFKSVKAAQLAVQSEIGLFRNPLKLSWVDQPPVYDQPPQPPPVTSSSQTVPDVNKIGVPFFPSFASFSSEIVSEVAKPPRSSLNTDRDYESITLMRMRQAQERKQLIEEMQKEDAKS